MTIVLCVYVCVQIVPSGVKKSMIFLFSALITGNIHDAYVQKLATVLAWESFLMS